MTISTRHPVVNLLCSRLHRQLVSMYAIDTFIGQAYVDVTWSNRPENKDGSG